jgi:hypothetical protein
VRAAHASAAKPLLSNLENHNDDAAQLMLWLQSRYSKISKTITDDAAKRTFQFPLTKISSNLNTLYVKST